MPFVASASQPFIFVNMFLKNPSRKAVFGEDDAVVEAKLIKSFTARVVEALAVVEAIKFASSGPWSRSEKMVEDEISFTGL